MPILTEIAGFAEGLDIIGRRFAASEARDDVVQLQLIRSSTANALRTKQMSALSSLELFGVVRDGIRSEPIELAPNAAEVDRPTRPIVGNVEGGLASVAGNRGAATVSLTVAVLRAEAAKALFTALGCRLKGLAANLAGAVDGSLTQDRRTSSGARSSGPLSQMARGLVERAAANGAGLVGGFFLPRHGTL